MDWATSIATACWASRKQRSAWARKRSTSVIATPPAFMRHLAHKSWVRNPCGDLTFHGCNTLRSPIPTAGSGGAGAPSGASENTFEGIGEPPRGGPRCGRRGKALDHDQPVDLAAQIGVQE